MSHPKTDICLVYMSPGHVLPRVNVVNEVLFHVGDGHPVGGGLEVVEIVLATIVLQTHEDVITILTSCAAGFLELP